MELAHYPLRKRQKTKKNGAVKLYSKVYANYVWFYVIKLVHKMLTCLTILILILLLDQNLRELIGTLANELATSLQLNV